MPWPPGSEWVQPGAAKVLQLPPNGQSASRAVCESTTHKKMLLAPLSAVTLVCEEAWC